MLTLEFEARNAVTSPGWVEEFRIVYDLMQKIHVRRSWGSGCSCCDERRKRGESVECHRQGKRLREVVDFIDDFDADVQREIQAPLDLPENCCTADNISRGGHEMRSYGFTYLRTVVAEALGFYRDQPASLANVETVAGLKRERDRWEALPGEKRHRVASNLFDTNGIAHASHKCPFLNQFCIKHYSHNAFFNPCSVSFAWL